MLHLAFSRVGFLPAPTNLYLSQFGPQQGLSCSKRAFIAGPCPQEGTIMHNRGHTAWKSLWFPKWVPKSREKAPEPHKRPAAWKGPLLPHSGLLEPRGSCSPERGAIVYSRGPYIMEWSPWFPKWGTSSSDWGPAAQKESI